MLCKAEKPCILYIIVLFEAISIVLCHVQENVHKTAADTRERQVFGFVFQCESVKRSIMIQIAVQCM